MKAIVLVGGEATRLRPLTYNTPKAMVPVLNIPFLEYVIRHLGEHQVNDIVLALGHLSQPIKDYLGDGRRFGVSLYYSIEDTPLGSAGAAKYAERYLNESFLVLNGDIFAELDFTAMINLHRERKAKATIAVTPVDNPTSYGLVETNDHGRVTRFLEKPKPEEVTTNMINAGAWLVESDILDLIPPRTQFSFERNVFPQILAQKEPVYAYPISGYWMDMGTPEKYLQLNRDLLGGKSSHYIPSQSNEIVTGKQCEIHPTAQIKGPVVIGANCSVGRQVKLIGPVVIGDRCTIQDDSLIEDSVIWRSVRLGTQVQIKKSIVADNCVLSDDSFIEESVLGENVTVGSGYHVLPDSKIEPGNIIE